MKNTIGTVLTLSLFLGGCASTPTASEERAPGASPRADLEVADLQGEWRRDDGQRYRFVSDGGRLVGYRLGDGFYGCRVALTLSVDRLEGRATFVDPQENAETILEAAWALTASSPDRLSGTVEAFELASSSGEVLSQETESHAFVRVSRLESDDAVAARAITRAHQRIDAAVRAPDRRAAITELATSAEIRSLGSTPGREPVAARLQALLKSSLGSTTLPAGARVGDTVADESPAQTDEDRSGPESPTFSEAWVSTELKGLAGLKLGDAHGWEGEFNDSLTSWTFEKYTPGPDGFNEVSRFYLDTFPGDAPADVEAYASKLVEDEDFQDYGYRYSEVSLKEADTTGFLILGTVIDTSDEEERDPGFVLALTVGKFRLLAKGSTFASPALRAEAVALSRALVPLLEASSAPKAHSEGHVEEMQRFLGLFDGSSAGVEKALAEFGVVGLATQDMHYYDLAEPTLLEHEAGERDWFTFEVKSGMMIRTYRVGWKDGSIVKVEAKGMR